MTFIELYMLKGALSEDARRQVNELIHAGLMHADGVPADMLERGRAFGWMVTHEMDSWIVGGKPVAPGNASPYFVRVSLVGGHLTDRMRNDMVARITHALAAVDPDPQRLYQAPNAWIHIVELPDGNIGAYGQIVRVSDLVKLVVDPHYKLTPPATATADATATVTAHASAPVETVIDPICHMQVALTPDAVTLVHDGVTYGFCGTPCRDLFVERLASLSSL